MSKMTTLVGPPRDGGTLDRMRAKVKAVATSPSVSTCMCHKNDGDYRPACLESLSMLSAVQYMQKHAMHAPNAASGTHPL